MQAQAASPPGSKVGKPVAKIMQEKLTKSMGYPKRLSHDVRCNKPLLGGASHIPLPDLHLKAHRQPGFWKPPKKHVGSG